MAVCHQYGMRLNARTRTVQAKGVSPRCTGAHRPARTRRISVAADARSKDSNKKTVGSGEGPTGLNVNGMRPTSNLGWSTMMQALKDAKVKIMSPQEVQFAVERGMPLIDVRPGNDYEQGHVPGAISVPFYQPIQGWTPWQVARRVGYAMFGVLNGTEVNPTFMEDAMAVVDPEEGAILYCALGGSLEATEGKRALQTRSLIAAYQLLSAGCKNLAIMRGGYAEWVSGGRDIAVVESVDETSQNTSSA